MKRSIARKWATALESGEYKQTMGQLRKNGAFCCLGVLCNLHAQEHPEMAVTQKKAKEYFGESELPPELVWNDWADMRSNDPGVSGLGRLAGMNDSGGWNFKAIAKVIRKHWKEL
jgi:hypothetical protein